MYTVNETEEVNVLLSNNYCSCIEISCEGSQGVLNIAITNPDTTQEDIICSTQLSDTDGAHEDVPCYDLSNCPDFNMYNYTPFFRICENPMDSSRCSVCFQNITELNITRLDFFWLQKNPCAGSFYFNRLYFKSIMINGKML